MCFKDCYLSGNNIKGLDYSSPFISREIQVVMVFIKKML